MRIHSRLGLLMLIFLTGCSGNARQRPLQPREQVPVTDGQNFNAARPAATAALGAQLPPIEIPFPPRDPAATDYVVDAFTLQGSTRRQFSIDSDVRVVVIQTNPFVHDYQITARNQPVAEASIGDFFRDVLKITLPTVTAQPATSATVSTTLGQKFQAFSITGQLPACDPTALNAADQLEVRLKRLSEQHGSIRISLERIETRSRTADEEFSRQREIFTHPQQSVIAVRRAASAGAAVMLQHRTELNTEKQQLDSRVPAFVANVSETSTLSAVAIEQHPTCNDLRNRARDVARFVSDTAVFKTGLSAVTNQVTKLARKPEELATIANDPSRFYITALLDRYHKPTDVTVVVARRPTGTEEAYRELTSKRLNFGGRARWSFSAGIAASTLGNNDFSVRTSRIPAPAGNPTDTLASIVVATKSSQANVFPMITFNTRLTRYTRGINPQFVLGVGTNNVSNPRVGFFVGGGADAFGERVVLTGGVLLGEETRLANGLKLGDRVLNAQAVVEEVRMMIRPAVSLTFRMF